MKRAAPAWYRNKWPWLLIIPPAFSVIGGIAVLCLALASNDGLVADDYYKRGLAINQTLERSRAAEAGGYRVHLMFSSDRARIRATLSGANLPAALTLRLAHPTRAGNDRTLQLTPNGPGVYEGALSDPPSAGRWGVSVQDIGNSWRLSGVWVIPGAPVVMLEPQRGGG